MSDDPRTTAEKSLPDHLGGHFGNTNTDPATLRYLAARYDVRTMLDVGCGPGGMLDEARKIGIKAHGIDGDSTLNRSHVVQHDYTAGPLVAECNDGGGWYFSAYADGEAYQSMMRSGATIDLIWCMEFVEHVEEQFIPNFLATFDAGCVLYLTAAPPGFPGWHHVNCQPESYWIDLLAQRGWQQDIEATNWVRANGSHIFSQRQGLVFTKTGPSS